MDKLNTFEELPSELGRPSSSTADITNESAVSEKDDPRMEGRSSCHDSLLIPTTINGDALISTVTDRGESMHHIFRDFLNDEECRIIEDRFNQLLVENTAQEEPLISAGAACTIQGACMEKENEQNPCHGFSRKDYKGKEIVLDRAMVRDIPPEPSDLRSYSNSDWYKYPQYSSDNGDCMKATYGSSLRTNQENKDGDDDQFSLPFRKEDNIFNILPNSSNGIVIHEPSNPPADVGSVNNYENDPGLIARRPSSQEGMDIQSPPTNGSFLINLIINESMHPTFHQLLQHCNLDNINILVSEILEHEHELLINSQGSKSIQKLMKQVKRKPFHAYAIAETLSCCIYSMMTNHRGKKLIQDCISHFLPAANQNLYQRLKTHLPALAMHQVGCIAVNECIDNMSASHKVAILHCIADISVLLSEDTHGNYVLQRVLESKNMEITVKILMNLKGRFVILAQSKVGSKVVEKCMDVSLLGAEYVAEEALMSPRTPIMLAKHQFGNYVMQKLIKIMKIYRSDDLYKVLGRALKPYCSELRGSVGGRKILDLIKDSL